MTGHAVHLLDAIAVGFGKVGRQIGFDVGVDLGRPCCGIRDFDPRNLLLEVGVIRVDILNIIFDVPVNALAQPLALGAAARLE